MQNHWTTTKTKRSKFFLFLLIFIKDVFGKTVKKKKTLKKLKYTNKSPEKKNN